MTNYSVPQKAGLYWARWNATLPSWDVKDYTMIIRVSGTSPFMKARAWRIDDDINDNIDYVNFRIKDIVWGPEIIVPKGDENA